MASVPLSKSSKWHGNHYDFDWCGHIHHPHLGLHASSLWPVSAPHGIAERFDCPHDDIQTSEHCFDSPVVAADMP